MRLALPRRDECFALVVEGWAPSRPKYWGRHGGRPSKLKVDLRWQANSRAFIGRKSELAPASEFALAALPKVFAAL